MVIEPHAHVGGHARRQQHVVLDVGADLAAGVAAVERDRVADDVQVGQPQEMGQLAVAVVVVREMFAQPETDDIKA
jgi:hypothetical protein